MSYLSPPISRLASFLLLLVGSAMIMIGAAHFARITAAQALACYSAVLPWLATIAILLLFDWIWEYVMGTWGIWEARTDLRLLAHDLSVVETWRMGGRMGSSGFLILFWLTIGMLAVFGCLFLANGITIMLHLGPTVQSWQDDISAFLVYGIFPLWALYGVYLRYWRWKHPRPALSKASIPAVPSVEIWRKQKLLEGSSEAIAFLALFQSACPEFTRPKPFPWKIVVFSLPAFSWHFYLWAGGMWNPPDVASISLDLLGCASLFWSMGWLLPWTISQTRSLLHPETVSVCRYLPLLRLRDQAVTLAQSYPPNL